MSTSCLDVVATPLLATAMLLLATAGFWRVRRQWVESIGLGAGMLLLVLPLGALPRGDWLAVLPIASLLMALGVLAASEWRFAPDCGQTGRLWALPAAARPALGAGFGLIPSYALLPFFTAADGLPSLLFALLLFTGLIAGLRLDHALRNSSLRLPFPARL